MWIRYVVIGFTIAIVLCFATIPAKIAMVKNQVPNPQAIFVLGGGSDREEFAAEFARRQADLDVWVSTGSGSQKVRDIFEAAGISLARLHLDYRAVDTVTNFTTMVGVFEREQIRHVYLLTSDFHMRRAQAIAFFVFGSQGITYTPVEMPCASTQQKPPHCQAESTLHVSRDVVRAIFWLLTKRAGVSVHIAMSTSP